jgi:ABC-2 type transport system ATP-binding protein
MSEGHPVYSWMRVEQYAAFQRGFYPKWNPEVFACVIDYFSIAMKTKAGDLSHGQRAGLHLALMLAVDPELLILDDPATGLDPAARRSLLEAMMLFTRDTSKTIVFSTHLMDDLERVADHVAILDYSVLRAACHVDILRDRFRQVTATFPDQPPKSLSDVPGLLRYETVNDEVTLIVVNHADAAVQRLESLGANSIHSQPISLEDALISYVGRQGNKNLFKKAEAAR